MPERWTTVSCGNNGGRQDRKKGHYAEQMKVHPADAGLVIGNRDLEANAITVHVHGQGNLGARPRNEVIRYLDAIRERR